ncbi:TPA: PDZ domain-containing protein [Candidatus Bathyarchaeota archaeon]|nr:PDZ domain-containing protein [Candidatus Bathyarchaeota archaeon]
MNKNEETFTLKVLLVVFLILQIITVFFLNERISELQKTIESQAGHIAEIKYQLSQIRSEVTLIESELQFFPVPMQESFTEIYDKVKDSVVVIQGKLLQHTIFGEEYVSVQGSGFLYNYSGNIVVITNNHVIDGCINITISFLSGDAYEANIIGKDPYSDVAILSLKAPPQRLKPLILASSSSLKVGQPVIAVGSPFGLAGSMTVGVVSQLGRAISESATGGYLIADVIQISVPINPEDSGGLLLNMIGEVVGITTAIVKNSQGVGFAIPSDTLLREIPYLIKGEQYPHPWLGVKGVDINLDIAKAMNINITYGWLIVDVVSGSPAEKAGLKGGNRIIQIGGTRIKIGGDIIIMINGTRIRNGNDLSTYLERNTRPNQQVQVTIIRSGQQMNVTITLGTRPSD